MELPRAQRLPRPLRVTTGDAESPELTVGLHTERTEGKPVEDGLTEALRGIRNAVEQAEH
ncbi:hypothetical protein [Streptomyces sp. WAC 04229]|uniref:hypothetical protein n=1 Tax=Streptomyces sp. WAC 04229 TaxID=2203206 RepID=UPI003D70B904